MNIDISPKQAALNTHKYRFYILLDYGRSRVLIDFCADDVFLEEKLSCGLSCCAPVVLDSLLEPVAFVSDKGHCGIVFSSSLPLLQKHSHRIQTARVASEEAVFLFL